MKKLFFSLIAFWFLNLNLFSQIDHDKAHRRYWYYCTRLINDFMKIGKNQGESIIIAERNLGKVVTQSTNKSQIGPDQIDLVNMYLILSSSPTKFSFQFLQCS